MVKFHINKNGKPAICRAKEGNCPLGGSDTHFPSKEDAIRFINKENKESHDLLPRLNNVPEIKISDKAFSLFDVEYNEYTGTFDCGLKVSDFAVNGIYDKNKEDLPSDIIYKRNLKEIYRSLPKEVLSGDNMIIREENLAKHVRDYLLHPRISESHSINIQSIAKYAPTEIELYSYGLQDIQYELKRHISYFVSDKILENPDLIINGSRFYIENLSQPKDIVKDYFESGAYEEFADEYL